MSEIEEKKSRRPKDSRFRQQQLPSWEPVLRPKVVIPAFFIIGIIFAPIGGLLYWNNGKVNELMLDYSQCGDYAQATPLSNDQYEYTFSENVTVDAPTFHYQNASDFLDPSWGNPNNLTIKRCNIEFTIPTTMEGPIYMYYRLTNFYHNHRQYIKSFDADQLYGKQINPAVSDCAPLAQGANDTVIYPCGLIANSLFNDTASNMTLMNSQTPATYNFSTTGIAWPTDTKKYKPCGYQNSQIIPPPNWAPRYPNGRYTDEYPPPDLGKMERFMIWVHVTALPDFRKIWARNDHDDIQPGRWSISIDSNFDTVQYGGTKWLILTTNTPLGGRNPYVGIAYMAIAGLSVLLGVLFSLRQIIKPRKLGDTRELSWNRPGRGLPANKYGQKLLHQD